MEQTETVIQDIRHDFASINISGRANVHLGDTYIARHDIQNDLDKQLESLLYFPEVWQRYQSVSDHHSGTCKWVLRGESVLCDKDPQPLNVDPGWTKIDVSEDESDDDDSSEPDFNDDDDIDEPLDVEWDPFLTWLNQGQAVYWISGKAGSGKSTLMKFLCESIRNGHLKNKLWSNVVSFWFWEAGSEIQQNLLGCLRSLLWQLTQISETRAVTITAAAPLVSSMQILTQRKLLKALKSIFTKLNREGIEVLVLLDGLDECGSDADELIDLFEHLATRSPRLRVCISSRPEPRFVEAFNSCPKLRLQDLNRYDIDKVIEAKFLQNRTIKSILSNDAKMTSKLRESLQEKAQGVFLWVQLAIKSVLRGLENRDDQTLLEERISSLPSELNDLYDAMLTRGIADSKYYERDAALYFKIILERRMTFFEFCLAINDSFRHNLLESPLELGPDELERGLQCDVVETWINVKSAGLLEVQNDARAGEMYNPLFDYSKTFTPATFRYHQKVVHFSHRTARTYILESARNVEKLRMCSLSEHNLHDLLFESWLVNLYVLHCPAGAYLGIWFGPSNSRSPADPPAPSRSSFYTAMNLWDTLHDRGRFRMTRELFWRYWIEGERFEYGCAFPLDSNQKIDPLMLCCKLGWFDVANILLNEQDDCLTLSYSSKLLCASVHQAESMHEGLGIRSTDLAAINFLETLLRQGADFTLALPEVASETSHGVEDLAINTLEDTFKLATCGYTIFPQRTASSWLARQWLTSAMEQGFTTTCNLGFRLNGGLFQQRKASEFMFFGNFDLCDIITFSDLISLAFQDLCAGEEIEYSPHSRIFVLIERSNHNNGRSYAISPDDSECILSRMRRADRSRWHPLFLDHGMLCVHDPSMNLGPILEPVISRSTELYNGVQTLTYLGKSEAWIKQFSAEVFDPTGEIRTWLYGPNRQLIRQNIGKMYKQLRLPARLANRDRIRRARQNMLRQPAKIVGLSYLNRWGTNDQGQIELALRPIEANGIELYYYVYLYGIYR